MKIMWSGFLFLILTLSIVSSGEAKPLYLIPDQEVGKIAVYGVSDDTGTLASEVPATFPIPFLGVYNGPSGLAADGGSTVFVTNKQHYTLSVLQFDPQTGGLASSSTFIVPYSSTLGGIDFDETNNVVYVVDFWLGGGGSPNLFALDWDPATRVLTPRSGFPVRLEATNYLLAVAVDETRGRLYVTDLSADLFRTTIKVYDTTSWALVGTITPPVQAVGLAVDKVRNYLYTTAPDDPKCSIGPIGDTHLYRYDLTAGGFISANMGYGGMGIAVDETSGNVYVTGGCSQDNLSSWSKDLNRLQLFPVPGEIPTVGPAGIAISNPTRVNHPPAVDAGDNLTILSQTQADTVLVGTATDPDGNALKYRWLEGETDLTGWRDAEGETGRSPLDLAILPALSLGEHRLTLQVTDGEATVQDGMVLNVSNSAPSSAPSGGGEYQAGAPVVLGGSVADFDGDAVEYHWRRGEEVLFSGTLDTAPGGAPAQLPEYSCNLPVGTHTLLLSASDGINAAVTSDIKVSVVDTVGPKLNPVADRTILWPAEGAMVTVVIQPNASDNSGQPLRLSAAVGSNEPESDYFKGDLSPDWTAPVVDAHGNIVLQLRAERSRKGDSGRVYSVTVVAEDSSGNASSAVVEIRVPKR